MAVLEETRDHPVGRETELIHLLRRVADKDKRTGEHKRAQHPKSLCQYLWKLAREENIYSGLVLTRVRRAPEGINRDVPFSSDAVGRPARVSALLSRTMFKTIYRNTHEEADRAQPTHGTADISVDIVCRGSSQL